MEWRKILLIMVTAGGIFFVFSGWDFSGTGVYGMIHDRWLPGVNDLISSSPLGGWKDGKLVTVLAERSAPMTDAAIKGFLAALFGLLLPLVHDGLRRKIATKLGIAR